MLTKVTRENLSHIKNPVLKDNARIYLAIESKYHEAIQQFGLSLAAVKSETVAGKVANDLYLQSLLAKGVSASNDNKSLYTGWKSPSCVACRTGMGSATYMISTRCPRSCFFCFNPNQENYERLKHEKQDPTAELREIARQEGVLSDIALTGGEPLLHKAETYDFFTAAKQLFPEAYTRLYTSGAFLDKECATQLALSGLDEIRFSIKTDDSMTALEETLEAICLARKHLPTVMVEMPVMPDEVEVMKSLLITLDELAIDGINLLELCFPFNNAEEFSKRDYVLKSEQFRVLYNYWYAGGLPIEGSEEVCLQLLEYACENSLSMGVHYCSLENKLTGQIYQQNHPARKRYPYCIFSEQDFFLKSAKVYGDDAHELERFFAIQGFELKRYDKKTQTLEFSPSYLASLKKDYPDLETAVSYHVVEDDGQGLALRELRLDLTTPMHFCFNSDI